MKETIQNLIIFMERVPLTGKEAIAWNQAYSFLQASLADISKPTEPISANE